MKKSKISPYDIELVSGLKQWGFVIGFLFMLCLLNLGIKYYQFSKLDFDSPQSITAQVSLQYLKTKVEEEKHKDSRSYNYFVLKITDSNNNHFYTTSKEDIISVINRYVRVYGQIKKCSFLQFLKSCYMTSYSISLLHKRDYRDKFRNYIDKQHEDKNQNEKNLVGNFYRTLFMADTLELEWRNISNKLGLAHIIAISGFHLGILSAVLYVLFCLPYRFFQRRYFTYRNEAYDLGFLILICMFGYLLILDYQPSFFRSFIMASLGFWVYFSGIRLLSFSLLFFTFALCIAIFPTMLLNIGFILSVSGVFYIFLFIKYFPKISKIPYWIYFNLSIFLNITTITHYFFPYFSLYQLISIPVSIVFIIFFPLSLVLHFMGVGGFIDSFLLQTLSIDIPFIEYYTPIWWGIFYVGISLLAIRYLIFYWLMNLLSLGFFVFLLLKFL